MLDEPLETKTVLQLRWWLTCHGDEPASNEKKAALIARYTYRHALYYSFVCL